MSEFLDQYGVEDARKEKRTKRIVLAVLAAAVLGTSGFLFFRNFREERVVDRFVTLLKEKNYQEAYKLWGCTPNAPCRYYAPEKFTEDWGPDGTYKQPDSLEIADVDSCGAGVVFGFAYPGGENFGLWVARDSKIISFAPWPRCPGPHLAIMEFLRSRFGSGSSK